MAAGLNYLDTIDRIQMDNAQYELNKSYPGMIKKLVLIILSL